MNMKELVKKVLSVDFDFEVKEGKALGLVGETGAGKTTTALSIMQLIPDPPGIIVDGEINFEGKNGAIVVNNADWLLKQNYVDFLREVGVHFTVNKMLTAECYKSRMEKGLTSDKSALDEVKDVAKHICETNNNDGVAKWLEKNIL